MAVVANDWAVSHDKIEQLDDTFGQALQGQSVYVESKLDALMQAYTCVRPVTQTEMEFWPRFLEMAAFRFWLSRLKTLHQPGYQENIKQGDCVKSPDAMKLILLAAMQR